MHKLTYCVPEANGLEPQTNVNCPGRGISVAFGLACCVVMLTSVACSDDKRSATAEESIDGTDDRSSRDASPPDSGASDPPDASVDAEDDAEAGPSVSPEGDAGATQPPPDDEPETLYFADGGVIMFEEPEEPEEKELPQPGDELVNLSAEDGMDAGVTVSRDFGGLQVSNACLHMKLEDASYYVVEGHQPPNDYYEPVLNFIKTDEGFEVLGYFPWEIAYPNFDALPRYLPEGEDIEIEASRTNAAVRITFQVADTSVWIRSIVVVEFAL